MIRNRLSAAVAMALLATGAWATGTDAPATLELQELRMVPAVPPAAQAAPAAKATPSRPATDPTVSDSDADSAPHPATRRSEADAPIAPLDPALTRALSLTPGTWYLRPGETLHDGLARWCSAAGWQFIARPGTNRVIEAEITFPEGTPFREAVRQTMRAYWHTERPLRAKAWLKNSVLELKERGQ
jgi:hypothetical protein